MYYNAILFLMTRVHLIRLYPNEQQRVMLAKTAGVTRYCYNWGLAKWNEMHERGEHCDQYLLSRMWTKEKPDWANEVSRDAQTKAFLNLGGAFSKFFSKKTRHPVFHKKGKRDTFYIPNEKAWIKNFDKLHLTKIGDVNLAEKLRFEGKILRYVVSRKADQWYVSISVELTEEPQKTKDETPIGIDVGAKHWAVTSDGEVLDRPKRLTKLEKRLKHAQRVMARKKKGSKNRLKARIKVARIYKRIHDVKLDAAHKFTSRIAKNHGIVCCEDLNVTGMQSGRKSIRKAAYNGLMTEIRRQLSYKAAHYVEVDRFYPSSKTCSSCGHKRDDLTLNDRTYRCPACGAVIDRDLNAAINIRNEGMRIFTEGHSESACGGCGSN